MNEKDVGTAYLISLLALIGVFGAHRFYLRQPIIGVLYLFTFGFFLIGQLYDWFFMSNIVQKVNEKDYLRRAMNAHQFEQRIG